MNIAFQTYLFLLIVCGGLALSAYRKEKDFFHPKVFIIGLFLLKNFVYLGTIAYDPAAFAHSMIYELNTDPDLAIAKYLILQTILFVVMFFSMKIKRTMGMGIEMQAQKLNFYFYRRLFYCLLLLTTGALMTFIINIGGLSALVLHWAVDRYEILSGNIAFYVASSLFFALAGVSLLLYAKGKINKLTLLCVLLVCMFTSIILKGGRSGVISLFIGIFILYNYVIKKVDFKFLFRQAYLLLFFVPLFSIIPMLRSQRGNEAFLKNPVEFIKESASLETSKQKGAFDGWADLSGAYIPIYLTDHFNTDNYWHGKSFLHLLEAPIPRKIFPQKGPIDEGRYITELVSGVNVSPPMSLNQLHLSYSWPSGTLGTWYMNFGLTGVIIAAFLMGKIIAFYYKKMKTGKNPVWLLTYPIFITTFSLSNHGIVSNGILFIVIFSTCWLVKKSTSLALN
jgi:oligosaccharide repeat unit polymerase